MYKAPLWGSFGIPWSSDSAALNTVVIYLKVRSLASTVFSDVYSPFAAYTI